MPNAKYILWWGGATAFLPRFFGEKRMFWKMVKNFYSKSETTEKFGIKFINYFNMVPKTSYTNIFKKVDFWGPKPMISIFDENRSIPAATAWRAKCATFVCFKKFEILICFTVPIVLTQKTIFGLAKCFLPWFGVLKHGYYGQMSCF